MAIVIIYARCEIRHTTKVNGYIVIMVGEGVHMIHANGCTVIMEGVIKETDKFAVAKHDATSHCRIPNNISTFCYFSCLPSIFGTANIIYIITTSGGGYTISG